MARSNKTKPGAKTRIAPPVKEHEDDVELARGSFGRILTFQPEGHSHSKIRATDRFVVKQAFDLSDIGGCLGMKELDVLTKLSHPNVIPVRGIAFMPGQTDECALDPLAIVFPRVEYTLFDMIKKATAAETKLLIVDILLGVEHMHRSGYMHRDLKPINILIQRRGRLVARIADFGTAVRTRGGDLLDHCVTTYNYGAPEQAGATVDYTESIDMWSVGCIIYVLLAQYEAFSFDTGSSASKRVKWAHVILDGMLQHSLKYPSLNEIKRAGFSGKEAEQIYRRHRGNPPKAWSQHIEDLGAIKRATSIIGSASDIDRLLDGLINFDPKKRMTATQVLNMSIFDNERAWITKIRAEHPPAPADPVFVKMSHPVESEHIKAVMIKCFGGCLEREHLTNGLYRASAFFLGLSLMDRYIEDYRARLGVEELCRSDAVFLACICLNIGHKYHARDDIDPHERSSVFPSRFMTDEWQELALEVEQEIVTKFSVGNMSYRTEYDSVDRMAPRNRDFLIEMYSRCFH